MRLCFTPEARVAENFALVIAAVFLSIVFPAHAQTTPAGSKPDGSNRQVIYSRSTDANGHTTTYVGPAAQADGQAAEQTSRQVSHRAATPSTTALPAKSSFAIEQVTDAERQAVSFTGFDLDVHLRPADGYIAVRAIVTVRNDGKAPLAAIPLQISSSLQWERIRAEDRDAPLHVATLNSDADHTGQLHEAVVPLARPLAPGASLQFDVTYSGVIAPNAQRLVALGAPSDVALHSDWDGITPDFTGLRGFGNVVWYPAASAPAILGDGARLFDEIGEQKLRMDGARFRLRLTDEFPANAVPTIALVNGHSIPLTIIAGSQGIPGLATAEAAGSTLDFQAPSLFVAVRKAEQATDATVWTLPADQAAASAWADATAAVTPFLKRWLGEKPRAQLAILDLPDADDAPFETGAMLAVPIRPAAPEQLEGILVHALARAWMQSPRAWLTEGVAQFMSTLWVEKQSGRERALEMLEADRQALALAEPAGPGDGGGQPLNQAFTPIYYRAKAAYVFWMLRDLAGDGGIAAALRAYNPAIDQITHSAADAAGHLGKESEPGRHNLSGPGEFERLIERACAQCGLKWFFADWVDADKGLPDLSIAKVYAEPAQAGNTLVGVTVANSGYAAASVPITVSSSGTAVTRRILVPARGQIVKRITIGSAPAQVQVNDGTVPEIEASVHLTTLGNSPGADNQPGGSASGQSESQSQSQPEAPQ